MLRMISTEYNEETNESFFFTSVTEGDFICMGRSKSRGDVLHAYEFSCALGRKYEAETSENQEDLDYWWNHQDEYINRHKMLYEEAGGDINKILRKTLNYTIRKVQLFEDDKLIKEETFRCGR